MHFAGEPKNKIYLQFPPAGGSGKTEANGREFSERWAVPGKLSHVLCKMEMVRNLLQNTRPASTIQKKKNVKWAATLIVVKPSCSIILPALIFLLGRPNEIFVLWQVQLGKLQVKAFPARPGECCFENLIFCGSFNLSGARNGRWALVLQVPS